MNKFIGRKIEKAQLKALIELSRPSIAVIYGRRRVGKVNSFDKLLRERMY